MKERTRFILQALVQDFIETATPVASKKLLDSHDLKVSSATIRNEFSALEEVGLIHSPHISAGRVPTAKGYRAFVDGLIETDKSEEELIVKDLFAKYMEEYQLNKSKERVFDVLRIVAQISGNVAFGQIDNDQSSYIGVSNVLRSPEFLSQPEKAAQIIEVLEGRERFKNLVNSIDLKPGEVKIFIGEENLLEEISSCAMLLTRFDDGDHTGYVGILGPMRMRYTFNKALLENALKMI